MNGITPVEVKVKASYYDKNEQFLAGTYNLPEDLKTSDGNRTQTDTVWIEWTESQGITNKGWGPFVFNTYSYTIQYDSNDTPETINSKIHAMIDDANDKLDDDIFGFLYNALYGCAGL